MLPICLVTGFLGSGKTTLLRRLVHELRDQRVAYVVNEFSAIDVDGGLVEAARQAERTGGAVDAADVIAIPGGSIFCSCLVSTFLDHLSAIASGHERDPLAGVVIEASGAADPSVVQKMLEETRLDRKLALASIVNVVDPGSFLKLIHTLPNIKSQAAAADLTLINKADRHDRATLAEVERVLAELNPHAPRVRTVRGEASFEPFPEPPMRRLMGELAKCQDPHFGKLEVVFDHDVDPEALRVALEAAGDELYRLKGYAPTATGTVFVDATADAVALHEASAPGRLGLAVITRGGGDAAVRQRLSTVAGLTVRDPAPPGVAV